MTFFRRLITLLVLVPLVVASATNTHANDGPILGLDRREVAAGELLIVSLRNFESSFVTISICGNLAKRGSADCNMQGSRTDKIEQTKDMTLTDIVVTPPPVPCPCLVRASSTTQGEFAVVGIELRDHPSGPVVDPTQGALVDVTIDAVRARRGLVDLARAALGGPTGYLVTVSVRNRTTEPLSTVIVDASARHRFSDEAAELAIPRPGPIEPGQRWTYTAQSRLSAPVAGRFVWQARALGAGQAVRAEQAVDVVPAGLVVLGVLLGLDVVVMVLRRSQRRRRIAAERAAAAAPVAPALGA